MDNVGYKTDPHRGLVCMTCDSVVSAGGSLDDLIKCSRCGSANCPFCLDRGDTTMKCHISIADCPLDLQPMNEQPTKEDGAHFVANPRKTIAGWEASYSIYREAHAGGPEQLVWKSQTITFATENSAFGWLESRAEAHGYDRTDIVWK